MKQHESMEAGWIPLTANDRRGGLLPGRFGLSRRKINSRLKFCKRGKDYLLFRCFFFLFEGKGGLNYIIHALQFARGNSRFENRLR